MKNKLLTVFDDEEYLTNVISALTLDVDEVYYVYHHDIPNENFANVDKVLNRYHEVKTHFFKLEDDVIEIGKAASSPVCFAQGICCQNSLPADPGCQDVRKGKVPSHNPSGFS